MIFLYLNSSAYAVTQFFLAHHFEPFLMERPLWSPQDGFVGTPDFIGLIDGELAVADYKPASGSARPAAGASFTTDGALQARFASRTGLDAYPPTISANCLALLARRAMFVLLYSRLAQLNSCRNGLAAGLPGVPPNVPYASSRYAPIWAFSIPQSSASVRARLWASD